MTDIINRQIKEIEKYTASTNTTLKSFRDHLDIILTKMDVIVGTLADNNTWIGILKVNTKATDEQLVKLTTRVDKIEQIKLDAQIFETYIAKTDHLIQKNDKQLEQTTNDTKSCANYLEKYVPLYI